jgi:16S rRNA G527 N7-methylase RsmG
VDVVTARAVSALVGLVDITLPLLLEEPTTVVRVRL